MMPSRIHELLEAISLWRTCNLTAGECAHAASEAEEEIRAMLAYRGQQFDRIAHLRAENDLLKTGYDLLRAENESLRQSAPTPGRTPMEVEM